MLSCAGPRLVGCLFVAALPFLAAQLFGAPSAHAIGGTTMEAPAGGEEAVQRNFDAGIQAIREGRFRQAIELMKTVVAAAPRNADAYNYLGFAYRKSGDVRYAAMAYETALKLAPDHKGALAYQGELFLRLGRVAEARRNLARLEHLCPSGCAARAELSRALADHAAAEGTEAN